MKMHNSSCYICKHKVNIFHSQFQEGKHNAMQLLLISRVIHTIPISAEVHMQLSYLHMQKYLITVIGEGL